MDELEQINQNLLMQPILDFIPRDRPIKAAIDETFDPYYGETTAVNEGYVVGGPIKKSTTDFYGYITLYLMLKDWKVTLSVLPIKKNVSKLEYIERMLGILKELGFEIEVLLMDRGFFDKTIFKHLMGNGIPHICPVRDHGKKLKSLLAVKRSRYEPYTISKQKDPLPVNIAIWASNLNGTGGHRGRRIYGYVVYGVDWSPKKVARVYRTRFGIESSYRMRNIVRIKTCTKSPVIRYYFFLVSMLLKNVWVVLRYRFFPQVRRGPRRVDGDRFRFDQFRIWIWQAFCRKVGFKRTEVLVGRPVL